MAGISKIDPTDIVGREYPHFVVTKYLGKLPKYRSKYHSYMCHCSCGIDFVCLRHNLVGASHRRTSCGCKKNEWLATYKPKETHGLSGISSYNRWQAMKSRCFNKNNKKYSRYGGRGITVCQRWMTFENFYADMGDPPSPDLTIDRIDTNGNYEPDNCRWASQKVQQNNRGNTIIVTINGQTKPLSHWCEEAGRRKGLVIQRMKRDGLTPEEALFGKLRRWPK